MNENASFVVIGAGLVGCMATIYLTKLGYKVVVYEYREDIRKSGKIEGKSINLALSHRGLDALKNADIEWHDISHLLVPMKGRMIHEESGKCKSLPYDVKYNQNIYSINRNDLNKMLLAEAEKKATIMFGCKVTNIDFKNHILSILRLREDVRLQETYDYLIGCDGAYSTVRHRMTTTPLFNFSQTYIDHRYVELRIPAENADQRIMVPNYLHIWPRHAFMMIALPNQDNSWTVTLFMPFQQFDGIKNPQDLLIFFRKTFPDALTLMGDEFLVNTYFSSTPQPLISIKCDRYNVGSRCLIIGDAAHAVVPFYGQGMNAGFEDCYILYDILKSKKLGSAFEEFCKTRVADAHAISDLSMYNYLEMRNLVTSKIFLLRKKLDNILYKVHDSWKPLYVRVTFSSIPYSQCLNNQHYRNKVYKALLISVISLATMLIIVTGVALLAQFAINTDTYK